MENFQIVKKEDLCKSKMEGIYLFEKNGEVCKSKRFSNAVILKTKDADKQGDLQADVEQHILKSLETYSLVKDAPSVIFVNSKINKQNIQEALGDTYTQAQTTDEFLENESKAYWLMVNENDFVPLIEELIKSRTEFMSCKNNIFVYILNPEEAVVQDLLRYITVSRSRFIYMNLFIENEESFKEKYPYDSAEMILDNCRLFFECDADKIESITYKSAGDTETIKYEKD